MILGQLRIRAQSTTYAALMMMMIIRIISSPRQRQSTASASVAGLLGLQETWSKPSEAERLPLLFLILCVRSLSIKRIKSTWDDQTEHEDLVEDRNISLGASDPSSKLELSCGDEEADQQCDRHQDGPHRWRTQCLLNYKSRFPNSCFTRALTFHIRHKNNKFKS